MKTVLVYVAAALAEIAGCFSFWAWRRGGASAWVVAPGALALIAFAWLLTRASSAFAGRAYAAYGAVYIVVSLGWLWAVEGVRPDGRDIAGALICLAGGAMIALGRHAGRA